MNEISSSILEKCKNSFKQVRVNLIKGARQLWLIEATKEWEKGGFTSLSEFVENECQLSKSFSAKLISVYGFYIEKSGLQEEEVQGVDLEKLYLALRLSGTAEEKLIRAKSWNRGEIKAELAEKNGEECKHEHQITICAKCHKRLHD